MVEYSNEVNQLTKEKRELKPLIDEQRLASLMASLCEKENIRIGASTGGIMVRRELMESFVIALLRDFPWGRYNRITLLHTVVGDIKVDSAIIHGILIDYIKGL